MNIDKMTPEEIDEALDRRNITLFSDVGGVFKELLECASDDTSIFLSILKEGIVVEHNAKSARGVTIKDLHEDNLPYLLVLWDYPMCYAFENEEECKKYIKDFLED